MRVERKVSDTVKMKTPEEMVNRLIDARNAEHKKSIQSELEKAKTITNDLLKVINRIPIDTLHEIVARSQNMESSLDNSINGQWWCYFKEVLDTVNLLKSRLRLEVPIDIKDKTMTNGYQPKGPGVYVNELVPPTSGTSVVSPDKSTTHESRSRVTSYTIDRLRDQIDTIYQNPSNNGLVEILHELLDHVDLIFEKINELEGRLNDVEEDYEKM